MTSRNHKSDVEISDAEDFEVNWFGPKYLYRTDWYQLSEKFMDLREGMQKLGKVLKTAKTEMSDGFSEVNTTFVSHVYN